ncbi:restriction endonuclease subunit S [Rothia mucilaginosa]|uniref:restriction endonuclease subunit S n=1 Tax=Rothia mucilaginosa TaxID=43675 RepID=UPI000AFA8EB6|nr:restriction endonuclease subunit S [Rothia mucilaginosa]
MELRTVESLCAAVYSGGTPSRKKPEYYEGGTIPWIKTMEIRDGYIYDSEEKITESGLQNSSAKFVPKESVLIAMYGATVGRVGYLKIDSTTNQAACALVVNSEITNPKWLYYSILATRDSLIDKANGAAQQNISVSIVRNHQIKYVPLEEQERIAGILGSLDDKIEANTRLIQTLDSLGEAATRKYLKSVQKTQKLNDIAHIVMGQSPKGETLNTEGSGVLFFQGKKDFGFRYPTPRTYTTAATRMAEPLDILFSVRAPIGALNRSVEACCVGRGLAAIRSSCGQENTLFYTLKTNPNLWEKFEGEGTIFSAINKKGLSELDIPFSETAISNGVEDFLTSVEQEIFSLEQENLQLAETRDALIKRLID